MKRGFDLDRLTCPQVAEVLHQVEGPVELPPAQVCVLGHRPEDSAEPNRGGQTWPPLRGSMTFSKSYKPPLPDLVIDRADHHQLEAAGARVDRHDEVGAAAGRREPARAAGKAEDPVIRTRGRV